MWFTASLIITYIIQVNIISLMTLVIPVDFLSSNSSGCSKISRGQEKDSACDLALTFDPCLDRSDGRSGSGRQATPLTTKCCSPLPDLSMSQFSQKLHHVMECTVIPVTSVSWPTSLLSGLGTSRMGYSSGDCPAFQVTTFHVAFHNLKCPYHQ